MPCPWARCMRCSRVAVNSAGCASFPSRRCARFPRSRTANGTGSLVMTMQWRLGYHKLLMASQIAAPRLRPFRVRGLRRLGRSRARLGPGDGVQPGRGHPVGDVRIVRLSQAAARAVQLSALGLHRPGGRGCQADSRASRSLQGTIAVRVWRMSTTHCCCMRWLPTNASDLGESRRAPKPPGAQFSFLNKCDRSVLVSCHRLERRSSIFWAANRNLAPGPASSLNRAHQ